MIPTGIILSNLTKLIGKTGQMWNDRNGFKPTNSYDYQGQTCSWKIQWAHICPSQTKNQQNRILVVFWNLALCDISFCFKLKKQNPTSKFVFPFTSRKNINEPVNLEKTEKSEMFVVVMLMSVVIPSKALQNRERDHKEV